MKTILMSTIIFQSIHMHLAEKQYATFSNIHNHMRDVPFRHNQLFQTNFDHSKRQGVLMRNDDFKRSHISGGYRASFELAKHVVRLEIFYKDTPGYGICSGSILSSSHILTAAHCLTGPFDNFNVYNVRITVGKFASSPQKYYARSVYIHKQFSILPLQNDVAIIHIRGKFKRFTFRTIRLPKQTYDGLRLKSRIFAAGFGKTGEYEDVSRILRVTQLIYRRLSICTKQLSYLERYVFTEKDIICATRPKFPRNNRADVCPGDSGGPTFTKLKGQMFQHGINSFGKSGCGLPNPIALSVNVKTYASIITQLVNGNNFSEWMSVYQFNG